MDRNTPVKLVEVFSKDKDLETEKEEETAFTQTKMGFTDDKIIGRICGSFNILDHQKIILLTMNCLLPKTYNFHFADELGLL